MAEQHGSGDPETDRRAAAGTLPDAIGWKAVSRALGVSERTAREWERRFRLPVIWFGSSASGYSDRLRACAIALQRRETAA